MVFDQIEEIFTLARTPEEVATRDHALRMIQRVVDVRADVKLIMSLRTEYYGRLLDHLRAGRRDLTGVRDDLLRDFSRSALIEAIKRPTSEVPLADGQPSPREKYGFRYAEGIPEAIADGVMAMRSENQDSVLPLAQVICTQLYERDKAQPGSDGVITREDLDAIKGVEGGLRAFAEDALVRLLHLGPGDRESFKALYSQLYNRQPDGTLTTWMMPRASLEGQWNRPTPFAGGARGRQVGPPAARGRAANRGGRAAPLHPARPRRPGQGGRRLEGRARGERATGGGEDEATPAASAIGRRRGLLLDPGWTLRRAGVPSEPRSTACPGCGKKATELAGEATTAQEECETARRRTQRRRLRRPSGKSGPPR